MNTPTHTTEPHDGEQEFLANYDAGQFPRPSVAVDVAIVTAAEGELRALVTQRDAHPGKGQWCLPGGFVGMDESLDAAAARLLRAKGGIGDVFLEQLYTFGAPSRDPRTRVISVAYYALVHPAALAQLAPVNGTVKLATLDVAWAGETGGPATLRDGATPLSLAFDHADILGLVALRLRGKLDYAAIGFELLPKQFTLRQLQEVHETILGRPLNKDSFRRRILASERVIATGRRESGVGHRPAALFRFKHTGGM